MRPEAPFLDQTYVCMGFVPRIVMVSSFVLTFLPYKNMMVLKERHNGKTGVIGKSRMTVRLTGDWRHGVPVRRGDFGTHGEKEYRREQTVSGTGERGTEYGRKYTATVCGTGRRRAGTIYTRAPCSAKRQIAFGRAEVTGNGASGVGADTDVSGKGLYDSERVGILLWRQRK